MTPPKKRAHVPGNLRRCPPAASVSSYLRGAARQVDQRGSGQAWEPLRAADLLRPPALSTRSLRSTDVDVTETGATAAARSPGVDTGAVNAPAASSHGRDAKMDRLVKDD